MGRGYFYLGGYMGLLDDLTNDGNFPKVVRAWCSVCMLLKELPEKESKALQARFNDKNITHVALSKVLKQNGIDIGDSVIGRHRRGGCSGLK